MTIPNLTVVEWADKVGKGFAPYRPGSTSADNEYWSAAGSLLEAEHVAQPPVPHTPPHPVLSLRYVDVGRLGGHWCFAVQGRGGESFGVAGTCRFTFAPAEVHPSLVWRPDDPVAPDRQVVQRVLAALATNPNRLLVPGTPAEVAAVIGAVLAALPPRMVRARNWATCLLQRPDGQRPIVTGELPDEFREADSGLARQLDHLNWTRLPQLPAASSGRDQRRRDALDVLTSHALAGTAGPLVHDSSADRLDQVLDDIVVHHLTLTPEEVPSLLGSASGRRRLLEQPALVRRWAASTPQVANGYRKRLRPEAELRQLIVEGLVESGRAWLLPLRPETIEVLREHAADVRERAAIARGLLPSVEERERAVHELEQLGLSPWDEPDLFPDRARAVAADLTQRGWLSIDAKKELRQQSGERPRFVHRVVAAIDVPVSAGTAANLLAEAPAVSRPGGSADRDEARDLAGQLADRSLPGRRDEAEKWLGEMLTAAWNLSNQLPRESLRAIMYGGLAVLAARGVRSHLRDAGLRQACEAIGIDDTVPGPVRDLLDRRDQTSEARAARRGGMVYRSGKRGKEVFAHRRLAVATGVGLAIAAGVTIGLLRTEPGTTDTTGTIGGSARPSGVTAPRSAAATAAAQPNVAVAVPEVVEFVVRHESVVDDFFTGFQPYTRRTVAAVRIVCLAENEPAGTQLATEAGRLIQASVQPFPQFGGAEFSPAGWRHPRLKGDEVNACEVELTLR